MPFLFTQQSDYYYDYPSGYYTSAAGILDSIDTTKVVKTGVLAAALWFLFPKDKAKLWKVGAVSAAYYFLG